MRLPHKLIALKTRLHYSVATLAGKLRPGYLVGVFRADRTYSKSLHGLKIDRKLDVNTAVVLHLYYTELWALFSERLRLLKNHPFDLFITLPEKNIHFIPEIYKAFPGAYVIVAPNRGRDVLPFLRVLPQLVRCGYGYVLKLHTKKSTHRIDGNEWLDGMINNLLPLDEKILTDLYDTLSDVQTGIAGPAGQYLSLSVNFEANGMHMTSIIKQLYGKKTSYDVLQAHRGQYGFFAGTMFWARLDAIVPLLKYNLMTSRFETEKGQIDATFAHAVERVLCLIPEIDHKNIYEMRADGIRAIAYDAGDVPDWSKVYIGPRPKD